MIEASFEQATHKSAAIGGIYQYDTGQRLRMHGLPTPEELAEMDDFLVGDAVTVQAQYGYIGDSQTETRLAGFRCADGLLGSGDSGRVSDQKQRGQGLCLCELRRDGGRSAG